MKSIGILENEHTYVVKITNCLRQMAILVMNEKKVVVEDYRKAIRFVREYADAYHHGKEEKIFFKAMIDHMGEIAQKLIVHGMNVEHDLGRFYMSGLEEAINRYEADTDVNDDLYIDIIGHLLEYANLLQRHADKENQVIYPFASRMLTKEVKAQVDKEVDDFEAQFSKEREELLSIINELENKYLN